MNDPGRWIRIEALFHRVVDLEREEREAVLVREAADDPELVAEVRSLIRADVEAGAATGGDALDGAVEAAAREVARDAGQLRPGYRIGPWRIVDELGRGGMGTVHLAERDDDEYRARAAIKVIRAAAPDADPVRRFRAERQILAGLQHPHVARLLDGGTTTTGRPWLALEYVDGEPLDRFCDERRLSVAERVDLFLKLCDAVQYAHRKLVVHRDIKPSNVLVTDDGTPKLLDFGIAKLLEPDDAGFTAVETRTQLRVMTPAYASPEQVRGETVTTATDVYALGLLLYELLCGSPAQRITTPSPAEMEREVCDRDPPRLASRVAPEVAEARGISPTRLARTLGGDLENIVLTALRKEPERRYASVAALADDLVRWREGRPVEARGNPWGYRTAKFVRRNVVPLAAAGVVAVAFVATVGFYTTRLAQERDRAQVEARRATEVATFLTGIFEQANPDLAPGTPLSARDLLERGAERIATLDASDEVRASMLQTIGVAYESLGDPAASIPHLEEAVAIRHSLAAGGSEEAAALVEALDALASSLWDLGELEAAEELHREALAGARQAAPNGSFAVAVTLNNLSRVLQDQGRFAEAREAQAEALELFRAAEGDTHPTVAAALTNLAQLVENLEGEEAGEPLHREAVEVLERLPPEDRISAPMAYGNLAMNLLAQNRLDEAETAFRRAIAESESRYGADSPRTAETLATLGWLQARREEWAAADTTVGIVVERFRRMYGEEHGDIAYELTNLATIRHRLGRVAEADSLHGAAVEMSRRVLPDNPYLARALNERARFLVAEARVAEGRALVVEAREVALKTLAEDHPFVEGLDAHLAELDGEPAG